ncbi:MAG: hypothetical protein GX343_03245 [Erysipelotrichaceae bacterium]|nr:hypothetical protein [Erysipelotrichaceae bacterium]
MLLGGTSLVGSSLVVILVGSSLDSLGGKGLQEHDVTRSKRIAKRKLFACFSYCFPYMIV